MRASDFEIRNYHKLDSILSKLCALVVEGQNSEKDYGMVAACVLDPTNQVVARLNYPGKDGKRVHAERAAIEAYQNKHGDIPEGSIIITTLSPCNEHMDERDGPSCTDIINESSVKKVYCGYIDPTQTDEHRHYNLMETSNEEVRKQCKAFADTFLGKVSETTFAGQDVEGNSLESFKEKFPNLSTIVYFIPGFGQALMAANIASQVQMYNQAIAKIEQKYPKQSIQTIQQKVGDQDEVWEPVNENFADGRHPEDKGDSKRYHVPTKASVSTLRNVAKHSSGRKAQLAHWMANMKSGRKK